MVRTITLGEMVDTQRRLNDLTHANWETELTCDDFQTAMVDEFSELLRSGRKFKWWKKSGNPNIFNEKLEVVDILHFGLSAIAVNGAIADADLDKQIGFSEPSEVTYEMFKEDGSFNRTYFMYVVREMLNHPDEFSLDTLVRSIGLTTEEVCAIYVAKATLNEIRQDNGYKTGEYRKVVDGVEDNERLAPIVEAFLHDKNMTLDDIVKAVEEEFYLKK